MSPRPFSFHSALPCSCAISIQIACKIAHFSQNTSKHPKISQKWQKYPKKGQKTPKKQPKNTQKGYFPGVPPKGPKRPKIPPKPPFSKMTCLKCLTFRVLQNPLPPCLGGPLPGVQNRSFLVIFS